MLNKQAGPVTPGERIEIIDVLRGLAVLGILIGNMQWFSGYGMMPDSLTADLPLTDRFTRFMVHFFVEGKFYSIFSFLFGFGFALQMSGAETRGDLHATIFKKRLFWLLIIGLLHAYLLWAGDILSIYALMGFLLILFRKKTNRSLVKWIILLFIIPVVSYLLIYVLFKSLVPASTVATIGDAQMEFWKNNVKTVPESSYFDILRNYNLDYIKGRYASLILEMRLPKILAMFLLGFYVYRKGFLQYLPAYKLYLRRVLKYSFVIGILCNTGFVVFAGTEAVFPPTVAGIAGVICYAIGVPALAIFYMALIVKLWERPAARSILNLLAPVGRMALTNYLLQTVICVLIFYGYGFRWFGKIDAASATCLALLIFAFQILGSGLWLKYFNYGPAEWIWRQLTYQKRLELRRKKIAED